MLVGRMFLVKFTISCSSYTTGISVTGDITLLLFLRSSFSGARIGWLTDGFIRVDDILLLNGFLEFNWLPSCTRYYNCSLTYSLSKAISIYLFLNSLLSWRCANFYSILRAFSARSALMRSCIFWLWMNLTWKRSRSIIGFLDYTWLSSCSLIWRRFEKLEFSSQGCLAPSIYSTASWCL